MSTLITSFGLITPIKGVETDVPYSFRCYVWNEGTDPVNNTVSVKFQIVMGDEGSSRVYIGFWLKLDGNVVISIPYDRSARYVKEQVVQEYTVNLNSDSVHKWQVSGTIDLQNSWATSNEMSFTVPHVNRGLAYIYNGSSWIAHHCYVYNGSSWDLYMPYIYNGSSWDLYT